MITSRDAPARSVSVPRPRERDYISFSAISTYRTCPLRHYFKYVVGLPEETISASLVLGGAIHSAVELHFNELMAGNPPPGTASLLEAFWDGWRARAEEASIQFGKDEDASSVGSQAERIIRAFQGSDLSVPQGRILGIEEELRGELVPGMPDLLARVDLIVETDDAVVVTDLKTARSRWSAEQAQSSGEQLLLYSELVRHLIPGKPVRLEFAVVTKAVNPVAERLEVSLDRRRVERTKRVVERVWRAIEAEIVYPAPSPMTCPSCPFREPCRRWCG